MPGSKSKKPTNTAAPFNIVWLIFFVLLIFWPDTLTDIWEWVEGLATVWQVLLWLLTLPYMLALAIWESDWETWQRILSVVAIALVWTSVMNGGQSRRRKNASG